MLLLVKSKTTQLRLNIAFVPKLEKLIIISLSVHFFPSPRPSGPRLSFIKHVHKQTQRFANFMSTATGELCL